LTFPFTDFKDFPLIYMLSKKIKFIIPFLLLVFYLLVFADATDADDKYGLTKTAGKAGIVGTAGTGATPPTLPTVVGGVVGALLSFLGVIFFILMIYGGFMWMTARGNEQQVEKAKQTIGNAIIGLVVVLTAYVITSLITGELTTITQK